MLAGCARSLTASLRTALPRSCHVASPAVGHSCPYAGYLNNWSESYKLVGWDLKPAEGNDVLQPGTEMLFRPACKGDVAPRQPYGGGGFFTPACGAYAKKLSTPLAR